MAKGFPIYSLQNLLNRYLKVNPHDIIIALSYTPGSDYLAARSDLEESFHLLHMARMVGGKQRAESYTTSYEHCLSWGLMERKKTTVWVCERLI